VSSRVAVSRLRRRAGASCALHSELQIDVSEFILNFFLTELSMAFE